MSATGWNCSGLQEKWRLCSYSSCKLVLSSHCQHTPAMILVGPDCHRVRSFTQRTGINSRGGNSKRSREAPRPPSAARVHIGNEANNAPDGVSTCLRARQAAYVCTLYVDTRRGVEMGSVIKRHLVDFESDEAPSVLHWIRSTQFFV